MLREKIRQEGAVRSVWVILSRMTRKDSLKRWCLSKDLKDISMVINESCFVPSSANSTDLRPRRR